MRDVPSPTTEHSMSMYASSADYWKAQAEINAKNSERWGYVARHWHKATAHWNMDGGNTPKALQLTVRAQASAQNAEYIERWVDEAIAVERAASGVGAA